MVIHALLCSLIGILFPEKQKQLQLPLVSSTCTARLSFVPAYEFHCFLLVLVSLRIYNFEYGILFCSNGAILVYDITDEDSFFKVLLHSDSFMQMAIIQQWQT